MSSNKEKIAIYTAITGNKDKLKNNIVTSPNCDYFCFTDNDQLTSKVWTITKATYTHENPRMVARHYKLLPHKYLADYEISVWVDAHGIITKDIEEYVRLQLSCHDLVVFKHPHRSCIYKEAGFVKSRFKSYDARIVNKQIEHYKAENYPKNNGLILSGVIFRKHNNPNVIKLMEDWWAEIERFSCRDQISFGYAAWKNKADFIGYQTFKKRNQFFRFVPHKVRS